MHKGIRQEGWTAEGRPPPLISGGGRRPIKYECLGAMVAAGANMHEGIHQGGRTTDSRLPSLLEAAEGCLLQG